MQTEEQQKATEQQASQVAADVQPVEDPQQADEQGTPADEAEAFAGAFAKTRGDDVAVPERAEKAEPEQSAPTTTEPAGDAVEAARVALAGLSEDQLKDLLARVPEVERKLESQMQKVTGKLGEFNRTLQQLQASSRPADQVAARKLAGDMLARTKVLYPDLADAIANDLNDAFATPQSAPQQPPSGQPQPQQGPTQEQLQQMMREQTQQVSRQYELRLLETKHPDYAQVAATPEFKLWAATLPPEDRVQVFESQDANYVSRQIDAFKSFRDQQTERANADKQRSQRRLSQAAPPTAGFSGSSPSTQNEEDAFLAGFARARGV